MAGINGPNIVTDNLLACFDAANSNSYSGSGLTWYDISGNGYTAVLTAGGNVKHRSNTNKGCFTFNTQNFTASGSAQLSTSTQKIGSASLSLGSTSGKATSIDTIDFGVDEWTIEFWFNPNTLSGPQNIFDTRTSSNHDGPVVYFNGVYLRYYSSGIRISFDTTGIVSTGNWYHIALTKNSSGVHTLWLDGTSRGTWTSSTSYSTPDYVTLGLYPGNNGGQTNGYVDELRVSNTARYTSSFTPSTSTFSIDEYTILLSHFNGADTSTTLDANDGYFQTDIPFPQTSGNEYTVIAAAKSNLTGSGRRQIFAADNGGYDWTFGQNGTSSSIFTGSSAETQSLTNSTGWHIYAGQWSSSGTKLYVDGSIAINVATISYDSSTETPEIGRNPWSGGAEYWGGDIAFVLVYTSILTSSEIEKIYNAYRGRYSI